MHPTHAIIRLDYLAHNMRQICSRLQPGVKAMAVVKANAYGHGAIPVARTVLASGASYLAVAHLEEGAELREAGITVPILVLGLALPEQFDYYARYNLIATISSPDYLSKLAETARHFKTNISVMLKVDTGMGRIGVPSQQIVPLAQAIADYPELTRIGLFSHFATADVPGGSNLSKKQAERFFSACENLDKAGLGAGLRTLSNSAGILQLPETHADLVRAGVILYGMPPAPSLTPLMTDLKPVMELYTKVVYIKETPADTTISYGATYTTRERTHIATLPIGYADGYSRQLSNKGEVLIRGKRYPIVGRICMDQMMIDLGSDEPSFGVGEPVTLVGASGNETISFTDLAALIGTINYELTCLVTPRVPRIYHS